MNYSKELEALRIQRFFCKKQFYINQRRFFEFLNFTTYQTTNLSLDNFMKKISSKKGIVLGGKYLRSLYRISGHQYDKLSVRTVKEFLLYLLFQQYPEYYNFNKTNKDENTEIQNSLYKYTRTGVVILTSIHTLQIQSFYTLRKYCSKTIHCFHQFLKDLKVWKKIDKYHLMETTIQSFFSLMELEETLYEKLHNIEVVGKERILAEETLRSIFSQKENMRKQLKSIDKDGEKILDSIIEQTQAWENTVTNLENQVKTQMEKVYWDKIDDDIKNKTYHSPIQEFKIIVSKLKDIVSNNRQFHMRVDDVYDFSFIQEQLKNNIEPVPLFSSLCIQFLNFMKELDSPDKDDIYDTFCKEIEEETELFTIFKKFIQVTNDNLDRIFKDAHLVRQLPLFQEWAKTQK